MYFKTYQSFFFFVLFGIFALPILALAWYNVPSAADDFCFALNTIKFGFWQGQKYYYDGWTGRYFSTFLMHANPLVFGWLAWYKIFPILTLLGLFHSLFRLSKVVFFRALTTLEHLGLVSAFLFMYLYQLPSIVENFYWLPGVVGYPVSLILLNYFFVAIIDSSKQNFKLFSWQNLYVSFLIFAIVGSNETPMLVIFIILGSVVGLQIWQKNIIEKTKKIPNLAYFIIPLFAFILLELLAPGNAVRMSYNPHSQELIPSILASLKDALGFAVPWLLAVPNIYFTILFLFFGAKFIKQNNVNVGILAVHPFISLVLWFGIFSVGIFPGYYGVGIPPPPRTVNIVYWFFLLGWFYNLLVLMNYFEKKHKLDLPKIGFGVKLIIALGIVYSLKDSPTLRPLYGDLLKGRAKAYHAEMTRRFENDFVEKKNQSVVVDSLKVYPKTLFTEDISKDPKHLWNTCQAEFWGIKDLKIKDLTK